jgi:hypothetical protein
MPLSSHILCWCREDDLDWQDKLNAYYSEHPDEIVIATAIEPVEDARNEYPSALNPHHHDYYPPMNDVRMNHDQLHNRDIISHPTIQSNTASIQPVTTEVSSSDQITFNIPPDTNRRPQNHRPEHHQEDTYHHQKTAGDATPPPKRYSATQNLIEKGLLFDYDDKSDDLGLGLDMKKSNPNTMTETNKAVKSNSSIDSYDNMKAKPSLFNDDNQLKKESKSSLFDNEKTPVDSYYTIPISSTSSYATDNSSENSSNKKTPGNFGPTIVRGPTIVSSRKSS